MALYARFAKDPLRNAWERIGQSTPLECSGRRTFLKRGRSQPVDATPSDLDHFLEVVLLKSASGTLRQDELTRISYLVGIYKALHILLPDDLADRWVTQPNDNLLFRGQAPVDYMVRAGIPGLQQVRSLIDAELGGH